MERFVKPVSDGGAPYTNKDIYGILQENNLISYRSILDEMNDVSGSTNPNNGIILTGCKLNSISDNNVNFDFTNSLIYLNGDFLEPVPFLATQSNYLVPNSTFYLMSVELPPEERIFKVTDKETDIVQSKYFDVVVDKPPNSHIEIVIYDRGGFSDPFNLSTRYLSRIYRYYTAQEDQIFMTYNTRNFNGFSGVSINAFGKGVGVGDMYGFALCDGGGSGLGMRKDLSGKFLIGFDKDTDVSPADLNNSASSSLLKNYGKLGNLGGTSSVKLVEDNLPGHNHGDDTGSPSNKLYHRHEMSSGIFGPGGTVLNSFGRVKKFDSQQNFGYFSRYMTKTGFSGPGVLNLAGKLYLPQLSSPGSKYWNIFRKDSNGNTIAGDETNQLDDHIHDIPLELGGGQPHNNLPPCVNIAYYQKIPI
jgi:hypothetical protein